MIDDPFLLTPFVLLFRITLVLAAGFWAYDKSRFPLWGLVCLFHPLLGLLFVAALSDKGDLEKLRVSQGLQDQDLRMLKKQVFDLSTESVEEEGPGICATCTFWKKDTLNCVHYRVPIGSKRRVTQCRGRQELPGTPHS